MTAKIVDSHCHLDGYSDLDSVLGRAREHGVTTLLAIGIGDGPRNMQQALEIAERHTTGDVRVWASAGIHPQEAHQANPETLKKLEGLAQHPRCLAVGEIGLDYYHATNPALDVQHAAFIAQLGIATAARKPITIHVRTSELATPQAKARFERDGNTEAAWDDLLNLLREYWAPQGLAGIMHCFSGNQQQAEAALAMGFYLSFAGNLTYPKSTTIQAVATEAPANRILVETDAPFLTPVPLRGQPNEPANVALTAAFLAKLRGVSVDDVAHQTTQNFHTLFPATRT